MCVYVFSCFLALLYIGTDVIVCMRIYAYTHIYLCWLFSFSDYRGRLAVFVHYSNAINARDIQYVYFSPDTDYVTFLSVCGWSGLC